MKKAKEQKRVLLTSSGPILHGSITEVRIRCGKKNCVCYDQDSQRHGPYYQWTGFAHGKRTTIPIPSKKIADECKRRIKNYKELLKKLETLKEQAIALAPWVTHIL